MYQNGQSTQDTPRIQEGRQAEAMGQRIWKSEARAAGGEASGEQKAKVQRILSFENSFQIKDPVYVRANTVKEMEDQLFTMYPFNSYYIGMLFSHSREGTMQRKYLEGPMDPLEPFVYVKLYLKKHPPLS